MSKLVKRIINLGLLLILAWLLLPTSSLGYAQKSSPESATPKPAVVLEMTYTCDGKCGDNPKEWSWALMDNRQFKYSEVSNIADYNVFTGVENKLSEEAYNEFIRLADSPEFMNALSKYDSGIKATSFDLNTTLTYRSNGRLKQISIRNYVPGLDSIIKPENAPPDAVKQIIDKAFELIHQQRSL